MAQCSPPDLSRDSYFGRKDDRGPSDAEILVFNAFKRLLDDHWRVYYSVWFRDAAQLIHCEADFLIVGPDGMFVFEVKGGDVERLADGRWLYTTKRGRSAEPKRRGPVDQIKDAYHAFERHIKCSCDDSMIVGRLYGYGIITPECIVKVEGVDPGCPSVLWLDGSGFPENLGTFFSEVCKYWKSEVEKRLRPPRLVRPFSPGDLLYLDRVIRPAIRCVGGAGLETRSVNRQVVKLTEAQCRALDYAATELRLIARGGAGTGKTLIAIEKASREAALGRRVLFVCYNRLLCDRLARNPRLSKVDVFTYHQLLHRMLHISKIAESVPVEWSEFNAKAPDLMLQSLEVLGAKFVAWDVLVVDEAQDLLNENFFSVLDLVIKDGLLGGRWLLALDTEQAIFSNQFEGEYWKKLLAASGAHEMTLPDNCRNTRQIAAYSHGIGEVAEMSRGVIEGRLPSILYFKDGGEFRRKFRRAVNKFVTDVREAKLSPDCITVLIAQREPYEAWVTQELGGAMADWEYLKPGESSNLGRIKVSTIQAFKGLESEIVLLVGLDDLAKDWQKKLFYVGATRARAILEIILPESQQEAVGDATLRVAQAIMSPPPLSSEDDCE